MRRQIGILVALAFALGGCLSSGSSSSSDSKDTVGGFTRSSDTYGVSRRPDLNGEMTRPTLPTMGAPGYGK